jgi:hypothetical protein
MLRQTAHVDYNVIALTAFSAQKQRKRPPGGIGGRYCPANGLWLKGGRSPADATEL